MEDSLILISLGIFFVIIGLLLKLCLRSSKDPASIVPITLPNEKPGKSPTKPKSEYFAEILIFFGSQSGTAAKYSNILAEEAEKNNFEAKVIDLEEFESYKLEKNICFFLMATYGEGDPTDNAKIFYNWLKGEPLTKETLKGLRFTVFGLGNSQYQHFNSMGKNVNKLLEDMGGERIYKYGQGDDNSSLEDDFMAWKEGIWTALKEELTGKKTNPNEISPLKIEKKENIGLPYSLINTDEKEINFTSFNHKIEGKDYEYQTKKYLDASEANITLVKEIRQNLKDGSTLHIEIDIKDTPIKYLTAQNLAIFPQNTQEKVEQLSEMLNLDLNQIVKIEPNSKLRKKLKFPFPSPVSVRTILTNFCDFQGPIMKKTLKELSQLDLPLELKAKLLLLASNEGKLDFKKEIEEPKNNLFNLIKQYNLKMTLSEFVILTPRISPRLFTISSSNLKYPDTLHVTASLLEEKMSSGLIKKGLISQHFEQMQKNFENGLKQKVMISFNESTFKLPEDRKTPLIMIGPGTGVAPFRAFLQEKEILLNDNKVEKENMKMFLYSGCKHQDGDYIYREEFKDHLENGMLQKYYMAFSRDQENKIYVQNLLKNNKDEVYELLTKKKATVYICGSTKMGKDVMEILEEILVENDKLTKEEAKSALNDMESDKRLIKELWG